jgi:glycosyltransferase involved in cell wall biosynthesis
MSQSPLYGRATALELTQPQSRPEKPVLLVTNYRLDNQHSMLRFATLLADGLRSQGVEVTVTQPTALLARLLPSWQRLQKGMRMADKFLLFPLLLRIAARRFHGQTGGLVHLMDQGNGVYVPALRHLPLLVTCHDFIAVKESLGLLRHPGMGSPRNSLYQKRNLSGLRQASWFACDSTATREDCVSLLDAEPSHCELIPAPLDPFFAVPAGKRPAGFPDHYLLSMGNAGWYKNRPGTLRIYAEMRTLGCELPLVVMGGPLSPEEAALADSLGVTKHLMPCYHPDDSTVRAAYAHAEALLFPSLEEGFGWPIIEAQAQGCLVVTTNRAPMTETGGSPALYVDPAQPQESAHSIMTYLERGARTADLVALRRAHAMSFSMDSFAASYRRLYQRVVGAQASLESHSSR